MQMVKLLFIPLSTMLLLASCGPSQTDANIAKQEDDRKALFDAYRPLEGNYVGTVTPDSGNKRPIPVEVRVNVVEVADGVDANRRVIFRPDLQGSFVRSDYVSMDPIARRPMKMTYRPETREIAMENSDVRNSPTPDQGRTLIRGIIMDGKLDGTIHFTIGDTVDGHIHVERVTQ